MEHEIRKINISSKIPNFWCNFIVVDDYSIIPYLQEKVDELVFVNDCNSVDKLREIKNRVMSGEKIVLYNLEELYSVFARGDLQYNDGIYQFYQRFTEGYRDTLWQNNKGQLYFVLTLSQYDKFWSPDSIFRHNHFTTMLTQTFDLTKQKIYKLK